MGEEFFPSLLHDRAVDQAILSMKKGAHLLKSRRRGRPKLCLFRLSMDEKFLVWYSGHGEKQLPLSSVMKLIPGKMSPSLQNQLQLANKSQFFSLIYANGERSLDLTCKDKAQADCWFLGLRALISRKRHSRPSVGSRNHRGIQSCANSPAGFIRRKYNLGLLEDTADFPQVHSLCGSPSLSLSERCLSDGLSHPFDSFHPSHTYSVSSNGQTAGDVSVLCTPLAESDTLKRGSSTENNMISRLVTPVYRSPRIDKKNILKDVMIWGEGIEGGLIGDGIGRSDKQNGMHMDALLPKLLESTVMLDVQSISLGGKHAALVTKHGEVFCWGEGKGGRLGHKINMDLDYPKLVDSLNGITAKSVACGEYQTCALTNSGELYTWGGNRFGSDIECEQKIRSQWLPQKLSGLLDGISISNVSCGEWHTAVVSTSGRLFTYGEGTFGALGHGNLKSISQPKEVESLKGLWVKSAACGSWHTAAIIDIMIDRFKFNSAVGKLFTWGDGDKGRLGHADNERKISPTCVAQLVDCDFVQVSCGRMLTIGLTNLGRVYTMGSSVHGQLGNPGSRDTSVSLVEGKLNEEFVKAISSGSYHVAALTSMGRVYTWGKGANGQLGLGDTEDRNLPTFVEALGDQQQVESIACGSNFTAAICLHRSITSSDQSTCNGCKMPFGFTRKKHNCYHCGLFFCRMCSSKKSTNAALAPHKTKASRVCDPCFNNLRRHIHLDRSLKKENKRTESLLVQQKAFLFEKEENRNVSSKHGQLLSSTKQNYDEKQSGRKFINQGENQQHSEHLSFSRGGIPSWGQVSCPNSFMSDNENSKTLISPFQNQTSDIALVRHQSPNSSAISVDRFMYGSNEMLSEEVQRLRAEVKSLELQCHSGNEKIQKCRQKIEEAWSIARDEAAECKAAGEVIKALALRLHTMSEVSGGREAKDEVDENKPHVRSVYSDSSCLDHFHSLSSATRLPSEVRVPKDRPLGDSLYNSPIVFSNTMKSLYGRHTLRHVNKPPENSNSTRTSRINGTSDYLKDEWIEQYEPGVYMTFTSLPGGHKGLKRVRFSRRRFSEKEAERWWEENQVIVYQKYDIEEYTNSIQSHQI